MKDKRVVFMGTPLYSVPVLKMLIEEVNVVLVVTQPDKMVGRKKVFRPCPVKEEALKNKIPVLSLEKLKDEYHKILEFEPDIIITCAYGQILPEELIYAPEYDTVNVHASILPKYRGGAPIHWAIINGEEKTGITIMFTDKGMDSGDIITAEEIDILKDDTYDIVSQKLSLLGASLLKKTLPSIFNKTCKRIKQDSNLKTIANVIKREDEFIDFNQKAEDVHNKIRGLSSVPGGYTKIDGENLKLFLSSLDDGLTLENVKPGTITRIDKNSFYVACLDKEIKILRVQVAGKKIMDVKDYLNGIDKNRLIGKVLG